MANQAFTVGDIVRLKSGGPKMSVSKPDGGTLGNLVDCKWFAGAKLEHGSFPANTLVMAEEDKKGK